MVVHEDTRVIEAKGNSQIIFIVEEEEQPSEEKSDNKQKNATKNDAKAEAAKDEPARASGSETTLSDEELRWVEGR